MIHKVIYFVRRLLVIGHETLSNKVWDQRFADLFRIIQCNTQHMYCVHFVTIYTQYQGSFHVVSGKASQVEEQFGIKDFCNKKIFNGLRDKIYSQEQFINKQSENHADLERVCEETN